MDYPGEKLLLKLWETLIEKGIGGALEPWQIGRKGKAHNSVRQQELLMLAQAEVDGNEIRAGRKELRKDGSLHVPQLGNHSQEENHRIERRIEPYIDVGSLLEFNRREKISELVRAEVNISKAIIHAEKILSTDAQPAPDNTVDDDWLHEWKNYASRVSVEELQQLWGQVLAGEIKAPGTFSLRTLEFLKGLSKTEAAKIAQLARFQIAGNIFRDYEDHFKSHGMHLSFFLEMQDLGIISNVQSVALSTSWISTDPQNFTHAFISNGKALLCQYAKNDRVISASVYPFTALGKQILELGEFEPDIEYLQLIGQQWIKQGFTVSLCDSEPAGGQVFALSNCVLIQHANAP